MPLVIPVGFAQAAFRFSLAGDPEEMVSTIGYTTILGDTAADMQTALEDVEQLFYENILQSDPASLFDDWIYQGASASANTSDGGMVSLVAPRSVVGTTPGSTPPQNCTMLIKKLTLTGGRHHRGRMYMPPFNLPETDVNNAGVIDSTLVGGLQTWYNDWWTANDVSADSQLYLLHQSSPTTPVPPAPTPISGFAVDNVIATQRRRLRR